MEVPLGFFGDEKPQASSTVSAVFRTLSTSFSSGIRSFILSIALLAAMISFSRIGSTVS